MAPEKEKHSKTYEFIQKHAVTILLSAALVAWTFVKDLINTGAEVKHRTLIVTIVKEDSDIDSHFRGIVKDEIASVMDDATTWLKVLDNDYLKDYTEDQVNELTADIDRRIAQIDSAQHNLINNIGKMAGIRNDEFVKIFSSMIREYKKDHIDVVHASF